MITITANEELICALADDLAGITALPGICYRADDGAIAVNPSLGNPDELDALPSNAGPGPAPQGWRCPEKSTGR